MTAKPTKKCKPNSPGPEAERLTLDGDWKQLVKKALRKKQPAKDQPKPPKPQK